jgi:tetratricopeptide (TPR) repeat protein
LAEAAVGRELTPREVSNYWLGQALGYITSAPLDWLQLLGRKWWMTWNRYEIPDTESYYIHRVRSWVLGMLGRILHFGVLCPLAAAGVVLTWTNRRALMPLYLVALTVAAGVTLFYVSARYRFPLVAVAVPFAAAGVVEWVRRIGAGDWRRVALATVVAAVSAVWVNWPVSREKELNAAQWGNLGAAWAVTGDIGRALPCFQRAVRMHPDAPRLRQFVADALSFAGRYEEAIEHYRALLALDATWPNAHFNLGVALERVGRHDEALRSYRRALSLDPDDIAARRAIERLSGHK